MANFGIDLKWPKVKLKWCLLWHFFIYFYLLIKADLHSAFVRYFLWACNYCIQLDSIILFTQLKKSSNCLSFFKIFQTMMRKINICQQLILEITVESNILYCLSLFDTFSVNNLISGFFLFSFILLLSLIGPLRRKFYEIPFTHLSVCMFIYFVQIFL